MKKEFNINEMTDGILSSNISYVSKAITLVESTKHEHQEQAQQIINAIIKHSGNSFRLGNYRSTGSEEYILLKALV